MNSIYFIEIKVVMSEHHLRYGCKNVLNIDFVFGFRLPQISFSNTAFVYTQHFTCMVKVVATVTGMLKLLQNGAPLLHYLGRSSYFIGGHYNT